MNRTTWLQDRRMQKFRDVLSRWERGALSMMEAGELLGMAERQFRRYRDRYEEEGAQGLVDRRLGKPSPQRVPARDLRLMLELYRDCYRGWNVKHFHEYLVRDHNWQWGYTGVKTQLHAAALVDRAKQLGIAHIPAYSPEARGRSERMFGTLQDRLPKELKLAGITAMQSANRFIREVYLPAHNARFAKAAALPESAFVAAVPAQLREILCVQEERIVARDNTVAYGGRRLRLPQSPLRAHYVKAQLRLHQYADGGLAVFHGPRATARFTSEGVLIAAEPSKLAA